MPYQLFEAADGHVVTGVLSDERWDDFVDVVGWKELRQYRINDELAKEPTEHWIEQLTEYSFPNGPLNDVADEQSFARGLVEEHDDPDWSETLLSGHLINYPDYDMLVQSPAPYLDEHTERVFADLVDEERLAE